jgi:hypothetical protein
MQLAGGLTIGVAVTVEVLGGPEWIAIGLGVVGLTAFAVGKFYPVVRFLRENDADWPR